MFEVGSEVSKPGKLPTVPLQESSAVLEIVLPYIYPVRLEGFSVEQPLLYEIIRALDKYGVSLVGLSTIAELGPMLK